MSDLYKRHHSPAKVLADVRAANPGISDAKLVVLLAAAVADVANRNCDLIAENLLFQERVDELSERNLAQGDSIAFLHKRLDQAEWVKAAKGSLPDGV